MHSRPRAGDSPPRTNERNSSLLLPSPFTGPPLASQSDPPQGKKRTPPFQLNSISTRRVMTEEELGLRRLLAEKLLAEY